MESLSCVRNPEIIFSLIYGHIMINAIRANTQNKCCNALELTQNILIQFKPGRYETSGMSGFF